jgi:hypothetical protein
MRVAQTAHQFVHTFFNRAEFHIASRQNSFLKNPARKNALTISHIFDVFWPFGVLAGNLHLTS